jgi:hypothetical protein
MMTTTIPCCTTMFVACCFYFRSIPLGLLWLWAFKSCLNVLGAEMSFQNLVLLAFIFTSSLNTAMVDVAGVSDMYHTTDLQR